MSIENTINLYKEAETILHDAVKTLRTNIQFSSVDNPIKTIVMTSVIPHDGKSTLSIFLGMAMAESGQHTLLIECDCRRPMLQNYMKLRPQYGLMDVLRNQVGTDQAIISTGVNKLDLLSCQLIPNPVEILGSERFQGMLEELKLRYDVIILDTPPLGSFIEAAILASKADGAVLVLQSGSTDITAAQAVVAQLEKAKARILGVVLNGVELTGGDYYYSDYYYRGGKKKHKKKKRTDFLSKQDHEPPRAPVSVKPKSFNEYSTASAEKEQKAAVRPLSPRRNTEPAAPRRIIDRKD